MQSLRLLPKLSLLSLLCLICPIKAEPTPPKARVVAKAKAVESVAHLDIAPGDGWMLSSSGDGTDFFLWNLKKSGKARALPGQYFAWSPNGSRLATWADPKLDYGGKGKQRLTVLDLNSQRVTQHAFDLPTSESAISLKFAPEGRNVILRSSNYKRGFTWTLNPQTGRLSATEETKSSRTMIVTPARHFVQSDYQEVGTQVQVYDLSGRKIYDWHNPNEYDVWELSSDARLMWRSSFNTGRFNFYDAQSGQLLWRLPTGEADSGTFSHYPQWSKGGQVVGFVKGQILRTYDARSGKIVGTANANAFHRAAFAGRRDAYAISQRGDFAMVAASDGELWRVSLR